MGIRKHATGRLCYIRCTELNTLEQTHGIEFHFESVKMPSVYVRKLIKGIGDIYYTPGHGIILHLNTVPDIPGLYKELNSFRLIWKDHQLELSCGVACITEKNLIKNSSQATRRLNIQSYISLIQGQPLLLSPQVPGDKIASQAVIRHVLQKAIDRKSSELMAQPIVLMMLAVQSIVSTMGLTCYHEIFTRIKMVDGKLIFPDIIPSVVRETGLLLALDITITEQTFRSIQSRQKSDPNSYFSINPTPDSPNKIDFLDNVFTLFRKYLIAPKCIIFEVIESDIADNANVIDVLRALRKAGSRIAIGDFGIGASSYPRLRTLDTDILKIDGSFIRNIPTDESSRCAVRSPREVAKLKNMEVVAELVGNEEIERMLITMSIGWLQGHHIGKPAPTELAKLQFSNYNSSDTPTLIHLPTPVPVFLFP